MLGRLFLILEGKGRNGDQIDVEVSPVVRREERRESGLCCEVEVDDKLLAGEEREGGEQLVN